MAGRGGQRGKGDFGFSITIDPSPIKLARVIKDLGEEFLDWRPAWTRIVPILSRGLRQNLTSRGGSIGESWPPSDERYVRRKAKRYGRIDLVRTGAMLAQLSSESSGLMSVGPRHVSFGTDAPQARAVNFGFTGPRGKGIKRRAFMGWSQAMRSEALEVMNDHARELLRKAAARLSSAGA